MDSGAIILLIAILILVVYHPATVMLITHIKSKLKKPKKNVEKIRCYHTPGDCRDCMSSSHCPMKHENVVVPKKNDYD